MDKLLLFLEYALNITVTTNTLVLSIKAIKTDNKCPKIFST